MSDLTDHDMLLIAIGRADGQTWNPVRPDESGYSRMTAQRMYGQIAEAAERCVTQQLLAKIEAVMDPDRELRRAADHVRAERAAKDNVLRALTRPGAFGVKPGGSQ